MKFEQRLSTLFTTDSIKTLPKIKRGLEKESLRVDTQGHLAQTKHPPRLGAALTHPYITTDYSEALLEFITPVINDTNELLEFLTNIHNFVYQNIDDEKLWVNSMPCILQGDENVPIARYGNSNIGRMKEVYRTGLGHRYGRTMQTIAGIHYNFSLPREFWIDAEGSDEGSSALSDHISDRYFDLIRNFYRYCWLIYYLCGASPILCKSFLGGNQGHLKTWDPTSVFLPDATSLRMSNLGYTNAMQSNIRIGYNSVDEFTASLIHATETSNPEFESIGVIKDGDFKQLNSNLLQIENEYYAAIRPKRVANTGEKPSHALRQRGVEYVEVRCLDLNPFSPIGITEETVRFLDCFLIYCLTEPSPIITDADWNNIEENQHRTISKGRNQQLKLIRQENLIPLKEWASEILDKMLGIAEILDSSNNTNKFSLTIQGQLDKIKDSDLTTSAQILRDMDDHKESFFEFAYRKAEQHEHYFKQQKLSETIEKTLIDLSAASIEQQRELEERDQIPFEQFLAEYFAQ